MSYKEKPTKDNTFMWIYVRILKGNFSGNKRTDTDRLISGPLNIKKYYTILKQLNNHTGLPLFLKLYGQDI